MSEIITKKISQHPVVTNMGVDDWFLVNVDVSGQVKTRIIQKQNIPFASGKVSYVDGTGGSDGSALRGDFNRRFATPAAAVAEAQSGDLIVVLPGTYTVLSNLAKNGVDWYLMQGAELTNGGTSAALFDDTAAGANGPVISEISGFGVLSGSDSSGNARIFRITHASSNVTAHCTRIAGEETQIAVVDDGTLRLIATLGSATDSDDSGEAFLINGGEVYLDIDTFTLEGGDLVTLAASAECVYTGRTVTGNFGTTQLGFVSSGTLNVSLDTLIILNTGFRIDAGTAVVQVRSMTAGYASGDCFDLNGGTTTIRADELRIQSVSSVSQCLEVTSDAVVHADVRRMTATRNAILHSSSGEMRLINCFVLGACDFTGTGRIRLVNVHGTGIDNAGQREPFVLGASSDVIFDNCVGVGVGAATFSIDATGSCSARIYSNFAGNLSPNGVITFITGASALQIDSDVV